LVEGLRVCCARRCTDHLALGSGGGIDVLLPSRRVAPGGNAYSVDMTTEVHEWK